MGQKSAETLTAKYLDRLHEIHATKKGTPELAYRAALENLLNEIGDQLDPAAVRPDRTALPQHGDGQDVWDGELCKLAIPISRSQSARMLPALPSAMEGSRQ